MTRSIPARPAGRRPENFHELSAPPSCFGDWSMHLGGIGRTVWPAGKMTRAVRERPQTRPGAVSSIYSVQTSNRCRSCESRPGPGRRHIAADQPV